MAQVICFDIDGVLTVESDSNYEDLAGSYVYRKPNLRARDIMIWAYNSGWTVVLYTGRREAQRRITEDWLHSHGFHYHFLFMGKPYFTHVIDDRAIGLEEFAGDILGLKDATPKKGSALSEELFKQLAEYVGNGNLRFFEDIGIKLDDACQINLMVYNKSHRSHDRRNCLLNSLASWFRSQIEKHLPSEDVPDEQT